MLTKRIIPCLDVKDGRVVKGINFVRLRDAGDPVEVAKGYDENRADEIVFLDITASHEKRSIFLNVVKATAEQVFMPLTVGGGIQNLDDIRDLLNAGADKVSINSAAVKNPKLIKEASEKFGSQCIVVAVDAKRNYDIQTDNYNTAIINDRKCWWEVYVEGGRISKGNDAITWIKEAENLGAGEILLTSMDYDGTLEGYDTTLTRIVSDKINIPIIASGGAGMLEHLSDIFIKGKADAVYSRKLSSS